MIYRLSIMNDSWMLGFSTVGAGGCGFAEGRKAASQAA